MVFKTFLVLMVASLASAESWSVFSGEDVDKDSFDDVAVHTALPLRGRGSRRLPSRSKLPGLALVQHLRRVNHSGAGQQQPWAQYQRLSKWADGHHAIRAPIRIRRPILVAPVLPRVSRDDRFVQQPSPPYVEPRIRRPVVVAARLRPIMRVGNVRADSVGPTVEEMGVHYPPVQKQPVREPVRPVMRYHHSLGAQTELQKAHAAWSGAQSQQQRLMYLKRHAEALQRKLEQLA